jgi:DNA recombination protein RmuC
MMTPILLLVALALLAAILLVQLHALRRARPVDLAPVQAALAALERSGERTSERIERSVRDEIAQNREEATAAARQSREELAGESRALREEVTRQLFQLTEKNETRLGAIQQTLQERLEQVRVAVEAKLAAIQQDNAKQLDKMRATVDEKLHGTLEKRLGESFKQVSERLEAVHKGLGEMQRLATGVGDLKKVLSNVKVRGTWGEVQLASLLDQVLSPSQYACNVSPKDDGERVEFAICMPGRGGDLLGDEPVWLPIDAKFPMEDYQRLVEAQESANPAAAEAAGDQLEARIRQCAKEIAEKYLAPPRTTDFGILYLPTEGLFSEVVRRRGLPELVQQKYRVVLAGPTTLWSILTSLQMGFRTLAIEKRSSEVWHLLAAVKAEWTKYGEVLEKVKRHLQAATNSVDQASTRTRQIGRKLRTVEQLPEEEAQTLLMLDAVGDAGEEASMQ